MTRYAVFETTCSTFFFLAEIKIFPGQNGYFGELHGISNVQTSRAKRDTSQLHPPVTGFQKLYTVIFQKLIVSIASVTDTLAYIRTNDIRPACVLLAVVTVNIVHIVCIGKESFCFAKIILELNGLTLYSFDRSSGVMIYGGVQYLNIGTTVSCLLSCPSFPS